MKSITLDESRNLHAACCGVPGNLCSRDCSFAILPVNCRAVSLTCRAAVCRGPDGAVTLARCIWAAGNPLLADQARKLLFWHQHVFARPGDETLHLGSWLRA